MISIWFYWQNGQDGGIHHDFPIHDGQPKFQHPQLQLSSGPDVATAWRGANSEKRYSVVWTKIYPPTQASTVTSTDCLYLCDACTLRVVHIILHTPPSPQTPLWDVFQRWCHAPPNQDAWWWGRWAWATAPTVRRLTFFLAATPLHAAGSCHATPLHRPPACHMPCAAHGLSHALWPHP